MRQHSCLRALITVLVLVSEAGLSAAADDSGNELVQVVVDLLGNPDKDVRALGLEQVRTEAKGEAATKQFAAQLPKLAVDAQVGLLGALADRGDGAARPAVLALLEKSEETSVRVAAIRAVGQLGQPEDLPLLVELLEKSSAEEKSAVRQSLERLRGEAVPAAMVGRMKNSPSNVRVALIEILATRRARETLADIAEAAVDADPAVRGAAMSALGQFAGPEQLAGMIQGALKAEPGTEREAAERAVAVVCGRAAAEGNPDTLLMPLVEKVPEADRISLLPMLGRAGAGRSTIQAAIGSFDPKVRAAGERAICNWPTAEVVRQLVEMARSAPRPEQRAMALGAVIRIAPLADKRTPAERLDLLKQAMHLCEKDAQRNQVLKRASAIRTVESLRFVAAYLDQPKFSQQACESIVELAHHRDLREPNKAEFHAALDKVLAKSDDATVKDRATRYKNDQTWARPKVEK